MTTVVLSRNLPQLGIANLRVRDQLLEIGSQQLAFTHRGETIFDCRLTSPIEADDSSRLCDDVAGWATALNSSPSPPARITPPPNTPPAASPGLTPAICRIIWWMKCWITLTPARATFAESSLLRSMNDALIVRVTGEEWPDAAGEIERRGLFLQRMDDSGEWFRYHPLFGSFLRQRCQWELAVELTERSTAPRRKAGWRKVSPARPSTMRWRPAMQNAARYLAQSCTGHV